MAVMHIGAPACGMNAAVRSFVRNCIYRGDTVYGIHDGVEGLVAGNVSTKKFIFVLRFNLNDFLPKLGAGVLGSVETCVAMLCRYK